MTALRTYSHTAKALAFPLGGIGTGNISLGAGGELRDWEIFNQPNKAVSSTAGGRMPNTFFALRLQTGNQPPVAKVLEAPLQPPYTLSHGYHPRDNAGLPRLHGATFHGEYPLAKIEFEDETLPVQIELEAFNPLIPLNPDDSGLPCAILRYTLTNRSAEKVKLTLVGSFLNPVGGFNLDEYGNLVVGQNSGASLNEYRAEEVQGLMLHAGQFKPDELGYGSLSVITLPPRAAASLTYKRAWLRSGWWDFLREFWDDLVADGRLTDLGYNDPPPAGRADTASLGVVDELAPGQTQAYTFIISWHFPNRLYGWEKKAGVEPVPTVRNHYAVQFADAWEVGRYVAQHLPRLEAETRHFHAALFSSTLPADLLEAIANNIVPLRSTTCFWLEPDKDGNERFFGWEGCFDQAGCCPGSCTHVWSYAYTLAYLFPSLERAMRRIEFAVETEPNGFMFFRAMQSFGEKWVWTSETPAAADGQMGSILRVYREWLLSGDRAWLGQVWDGVKRAIAYAEAYWDTDHDGVLDGKQHNTYDIEFYGPNPLCGIYYLAALRAVEELAKAMNEPELAAHCREIYQRGSPRLDELLWNGAYYIQRLPDVNAHPYQHGLGCLSDQLLGQLHALLLGLGHLLPKDHARTTIKSIFEHNFRPDLSEHVNCQRTYALNDEAGLLMCTWPQGDEPRYPFPYSDEVWTGTEYHVAAHLLLEGWLEEGMAIVKAVRQRQDGVKRNPWNEVECGHHYARSMSSWALLLAASGFHCDMDKNEISFKPLVDLSTQEDEVTVFWSTGRGWGTYTQRRNPATGEWQPSVQVLGGDMVGVKVKACNQAWVL